MSITKKFKENESGSYAVIFAIAVPALMLAAGISVDYSRVSSDKIKGQGLLDSAVLEAATAFKKHGNQTMAMKQAKRFVSASWPVGSELSMNFKVQGTQVVGTISSETKSSFMSIAGIKSTKWGIESAASIGTPPKTEFALAIDISSSMEAGGHMNTLRSALKDFSEKALGDNSGGEGVVSLVPYANAVSFPLSYQKWLDPNFGLSQTSTFSGCFIDKNDAQPQVTHSAHGTDNLIAAPDLVKSTQNGDNIFCPRSDTQISMFVTDKTTLDSKISALKSYQGTNTSEALSWAWRTLDPSWKSAFDSSDSHPRDYSSGNVKSLVLFTDGMPYERPWTEDRIAKSEKETLREKETAVLKGVCAAIKSDGKINVYVVAYGNDMTRREKTTLAGCVSGNGQYFDANARNLGKVFNEIALSTAKIALTR